MNALAKLNQAEKLLAETKNLSDLKQIHDIARAAEAYAQAHGLGITLENHAMEIRLLAARRIGELVPKEQGKRTDIKSTSPNHGEVNITSQRLSDFRKLAEIPMPEFKGKIEEAKAKQEKISYYKILQTGPHVSHNSGENEWYTPPEYIEAARYTMGTIDTDPASSIEANQTVKAKTFYTIETDGRSKSWCGNVWMNPPYAQPLIDQFCKKIVEEFKSGNCNQAIILVNNATETEWFQTLLSCAGPICFPQGRIKFIDKKGNPSGAPLQGQAIIYFGHKTDKFIKTFSKFGVILIRWNEE